MSDATPPDDQPTQPPTPPERAMFGDLSVDEERAMKRLARKRAAVWGAGTGAAMAIVLVLCVLLLYLASQRGG